MKAFGNHWAFGASLRMLAALIYLSPAETPAQAPVPLWVGRYSGPGNFNDVAQAVAVDGSNEVVVTGGAYNGSNNDWTTIKYSSAGATRWTKIYNGTGRHDAIAYAVAVDGSNNVIVTGESASDYATIKYSSAGVPLWTNLYDGPGQYWDSARAVVVDGHNRVGGRIDLPPPTPPSMRVRTRRFRSD